MSSCLSSASLVRGSQGPATVPHDHSRIRIETSLRFLGYHRGQFGTQGLAGELREFPATVLSFELREDSQ